MKKRPAVFIGVAVIALLLGISRFGSKAGRTVTGLRIVKETEDCAAVNCYESSSEGHYLYDGSIKVSRVDNYFYSDDEMKKATISPSGEYAAFGNADKVWLYKSDSGQLKDITDAQSGRIQRYEWKEDQSQLIVAYPKTPFSDYFPPSIIPLD